MSEGAGGGGGGGGVAGDFHIADPATAAAAAATPAVAVILAVVVVAVVVVVFAPAQNPAGYEQTQVWIQARGSSGSSTDWVGGDSGAHARSIHGNTSDCVLQHAQDHY